MKTLKLGDKRCRFCYAHLTVEARYFYKDCCEACHIDKDYLFAERYRTLKSSRFMLRVIFFQARQIWHFCAFFLREMKATSENKKDNH